MNVVLRVIIFVSFSAALAVALNANAQDESSAGASGPAQPAAPKAATATSNSKDPKKNVVNFEDQLVEGQTQKPELFYLLQQKNANFKRLIRLRDNFLPEMRATAEEIGRGGRGKNSNSNQNQGQ